MWPRSIDAMRLRAPPECHVVGGVLQTAHLRASQEVRRAMMSGMPARARRSVEVVVVGVVYALVAILSLQFALEHTNASPV